MSPSPTIPFRTINFPFPLPSPESQSFIIKPPTPTTLWRTPPHPSHDIAAVNDASAPMIFKSLAVSKFESCKARVELRKSAGEYEQGGLVFVLPAPEAEGRRDGEDDNRVRVERGKWIKVGLERWEDRFWISIATANPYADWSMLPLPLSPGTSASASSSDPAIEFEISRHPRKSRLFIYYIDPSTGIKTPLREVTWALAEEFEEQERLKQEKECWVGVYAGSRLDGSEGGAFQVAFGGWQLDVRK